MPSDFLLAKDKQHLRRAANAMEQVVTSVRQRSAAPPSPAGIGIKQPSGPTAPQLLWHHIQEATRLLMLCGLTLGTIEGLDKAEAEQRRQPPSRIKVVPR
jgi:hypothetical protein